MKEEILAKNIKKVNRWGAGLAVFVTKEVKAFGWNDKTYVIVSAIRDDEGEKIVIRKAVIS
ncbi:MAG: hypothetical protein V3T58_05660 [Candidatus Hydrothermarchaeales archaeon]